MTDDRTQAETKTTQAEEPIEVKADTKADTKTSPFLIDSPEKWTEASKISFDFALDTAVGQRVFKCKALSLAANKRHERDYPMIAGTYDVNNEEDMENRMRVYEMRKVMAIDDAWGTLPGKTAEKKLDWINANIGRPGDMDKLYQDICDNSAWYSNPLTSSKLSSEATVEEVPGPKVIESPEDWAKDSVEQTLLCLSVRGGVMKFPLTPINATAAEKINKETAFGRPPVKLTKTKSGMTMRPEVGGDEDPDDPIFVKQCAKKFMKRTVMYLEAALPWDIPGKTHEEKIAWLGDRPVGEVESLYVYIVQDLSNVRDRTDFSFGG